MPKMEDVKATSLNMLKPEDRQIVEEALDSYAFTIQSIQTGDADMDYTYTADDVATIDAILAGVPAYQALIPDRVTASKKAIEGNEAEKSQGLTEALAWTEKVKALITEK